MSLTEKFKNVKDWYAPDSLGNAPSYTEVEAIIKKLDTIKSHEYTNFVKDAIELGNQYYELYKDDWIDNDKYNFKQDVAPQTNAFEYYKLLYVVDFFSENDTISYAKGEMIPYPMQRDINNEKIC